MYRPVMNDGLSAAPEAIGNHPLHILLNLPPPRIGRERAQIFQVHDGCLRL